MPVRLQRKQYRQPMPPGSRGVARPSRFQNAYDMKTYGAPEVCVQLFLEKHEHDPEYRARVVRELRGKALWCYCPLGQACHADVLLGWANAPLPS
jgi:hypothetical protein